MLEQLFELLCCLGSVGTFFFVDAIPPCELPLASSSRLQPVHCPLPVFEGTSCRFTCTFPLCSHPPEPSHICSHSRCIHSFDSPHQSSTHPLQFFLSVRARCTCVFVICVFSRWWKVWSWVRLSVLRSLLMRRGRRFVWGGHMECRASTLQSWRVVWLCL